MSVCYTMSPVVRGFWDAFLAQSDDPRDAEARFFETFQIGATEEEAPCAQCPPPGARHAACPLTPRADRGPARGEKSAFGIPIHPPLSVAPPADVSCGR